MAKKDKDEARAELERALSSPPILYVDNFPKHRESLQAREEAKSEVNRAIDQQINRELWKRRKFGTLSWSELKTKK